MTAVAMAVFRHGFVSVNVTSFVRDFLLLDCIMLVILTHADAGGDLYFLETNDTDGAINSWYTSVMAAVAMGVFQNSVVTVTVTSIIRDFSLLDCTCTMLVILIHVNAGPDLRVPVVR